MNYLILIQFLYIDFDWWNKKNFSNQTAPTPFKSWSPAKFYIFHEINGSIVIGANLKSSDVEIGLLNEECKSGYLFRCLGNILLCMFSVYCATEVELIETPSIYTKKSSLVFFSAYYSLAVKIEYLYTG